MNEKIKHTPGPWTVEPSMDLWGHYIIQEAYDQTEDSEDSFEIDEANAKLIAAAPDLLEACQWALAWLEEYEQYISDGPIGDSEEYRRLQKAIKKATS